ncbi:MAG TPA: flagellar basal body P-ring protein FlgI [Longimicrobiaceae bacterium]|nr:flagellar basal body P-ring protein FlgI [Longimicrobiaceae bacterium]
MKILAISVLGLAIAAAAVPADAQQTLIRDLTMQEEAVPIRLMGYGLVVGLDGTGDRALGGRGSGMTVQSVANLLRRFDIDVPAEVLRTRNVAAVLVTAEVSPYLRPGGRFEIHVSSMGDARSIRGGVLWMTPLVSEVGNTPVASAQGALLISDGTLARSGYTVETTARIPDGGLLEGELSRPTFASTSRLLLRKPDLGTARRIADAINAAIGDGTALVEDPGSVALTLPDAGPARTGALVEIGELAVVPVRHPRVVIDGRDGTVVTGGELAVGAAMVSHGAVTLTIGGAPAAAGPAAIPGDVRVPVGTSAQDIASALYAVQTPPGEIAAIFEALREVGAIAAEVVVR